MRFLEKILLTLVIVLALILVGLIFFPDGFPSIADTWNSLKDNTFDFTELTGTGEEVHGDADAAYGNKGSSYSFDTEADAYYAMLNDQEKNVYAQLYANAMDMKAGFGVDEKINASELETVFQSLFYDHPELFWLDNTYSYQYDGDTGNILTVTLSFNDAADDIETSRSTFDAAANEIINGALQYSTDYEKEKYVHDALRQLVEYDINAPDNQSAWSALVNQRTVCAGYARAFQYLMNQLGVETYYVVGTSEGQEHAWNMVQLDGNFYNVDVTWDDAAGDTDPYYFFNIPDDEFDAYHARSGLSLNLPACTASAYTHLEDGSIYDHFRFKLAD